MEQKLTAIHFKITEVVREIDKSTFDDKNRVRNFQFYI